MVDSKQFQEFLDMGQYTKHGLEKYEWIFGDTFLSTGGMGTTIEVLKHVQLPDNPKVLDIGSGLGGHSFIFAEKFNADVIGLDLSENMLDIARRHLENRPHLKDHVEFVLDDCTKINFPENSFDLIYSRDAFLHISDKASLFKNVAKWLKPGGYFVFTDYVKGEDERKYTKEFRTYLKQRDYAMITKTEYEVVLNGSGFKTVKVEDWRKQFKNALSVELLKLQSHKEEFLRKFSKEDYEDLEDGWINKVQRANDGNQGWVLAVARK